MCVAAVGKVIKVNGGQALCSFDGVLKEVSIALLPMVQPGDNVVVHSGFASEIVKDRKKLYRDIVSTDSFARQILEAIERENKKLKNRHIQLMHFCGSHEDLIVKYGLRELLPDNIQLISGPTCSMCVLPECEIELGLKIAQKEDVILTVFEDLLYIRTRLGSLIDFKERGSHIKVVYDINQALQIAKSTKKEVVYFSIGFENTIPAIAQTLLEAKDVDNFSIISSHRTVIPAMDYVLQISKVDGAICPGHIAMVIGVKPFEQLSRKHQSNFVIAGFEPIDILKAVLTIIREINNNTSGTINQYTRIVEEQGDILAQKKIKEVFSYKDAVWRGFPSLPNSRLILRKEFDNFNAEKKFAIPLLENCEELSDKCICGDILKGKKPQECMNFYQVCTPITPQGPCIVSKNGACYISYQNES